MKRNGYDTPPGWDAYEHRDIQSHGLLDPPVDVRECACGGEIVVTHINHELDVQVAILSHNDTPQHKAWRERRR